MSTASLDFQVISRPGQSVLLVGNISDSHPLVQRLAFAGAQCTRVLTLAAADFYLLDPRYSLVLLGDDLDEDAAVVFVANVYERDARIRIVLLAGALGLLCPRATDDNTLRLAA